MRSIIKTFSLLLLASLSLTACVTSDMFESFDQQASTPTVREESDNLLYFLITKDQSNIIGIGERYHYVLPAIKEVPELLKASYSQHMYSNISGVAIRKEGKKHNFTAHLAIALDPRTLTSKQIQQAQQLGFSTDMPDNATVALIFFKHKLSQQFHELRRSKQILYLKVPLKGELYSVEQGVDYGLSKNHDYKTELSLRFIGPPSMSKGGATAAKVLLSPFTFLGDVVTGVVGAVVVPVMIMNCDNMLSC
ncbi:MAG: hypothetical protein Q4G54_03070 [Pelistega sp.]|nr:hypothetical protein [Pelistega sp.]